MERRVQMERRGRMVREGWLGRRGPMGWWERVVRRGRVAVVPVGLAVLIGLSGVVLSRITAGPVTTWLVFGAGTGAVLVGVAARRLPAAVVGPLSVAALAGYATFGMWITAVHRSGAPGGFGELARCAVRDAVPRLLTAPLPIEPTPDTVLVSLVAAWLAGLTGTELGVRAGRVLTGLLPPTMLFTATLYLVGPNASPGPWPAVAFAGTGVLMLATGGSPCRQATGGDATRPGPSSIVGTAGVVLGVVGLTALTGPVLAGWVNRQPVDPRRYVQPPVVDSPEENPLARVAGWALDPGQELFRITTSTDTGTDLTGTGTDAAVDAGIDAERRLDDAPDLWFGTPIRLAVLTDYDGVAWRSRAVHRFAGRVLPNPGSPGTGRADTIRQEITITGLSGRLLPAAPVPHRVTEVQVAYDPETGTLLRPEGLSPGLRYTVTSVRRHPDPNLLAEASVPTGVPVSQYLRVPPGTPEQLRKLAGQLAADDDTPYGRASALADFLAGHYRLVADAPGGHAYPNLVFFLFGPTTGGGRQGTAEQFAAGYAVLGRMMGLPTRVVVGFQPPAESGPVRGADALAWPEVLFDGVGWVAFDPRPRPDTDHRPVEDGFRPLPEEPPPAEKPVTTPPGDPEPTSPAAAQPPAPGTGPKAPLTLLATVAAGLLVLAGPPGAVAWLRRVRRDRRLRRGTPAQRVAGAWRVLTDALRLAGRPVPAHLTATEVAGYAREAIRHSAAPPVGELADLVNRAVFAPDGVDHGQADRAGKLAVAYADRLRAGLAWWRRVVWSTHPGPLYWHR